jgi:hypothetical protein
VLARGARVAELAVMTKLVLIALACAACTGPQTEDSTTPACNDSMTQPNLDWIQTNVFTPSCVLGGCHMGAASNAGHMSLEVGKSYDSLVNAPSQIQIPWKRVVPGDPKDSYLLVALGAEGGPPPPDGEMPLSSPGLCAAKLDAIEAWITAGAAD